MVSFDFTRFECSFFSLVLSVVLRSLVSSVVFLSLVLSVVLGKLDHPDQISLYTGYALLGAGLTVGLSSLSAGYAIGVVKLTVVF